MKKTLLALCAAVGISFAGNAQWQQQDLNFTNPFRIVTDISIVNANTSWVIASNGGGSSIPSSADYARTIDGGTTWTPGTIPGLSSFVLTSISALNADTAWVTAAGGSTNGARIYRTYDGGANWTRQNNAGFATTGYANAIHFFNATDGVALGDESNGYTEIYTTTNGGTNWTRVPQTNLPTQISGEYSYFDAIAVIGNTIWYSTSEGRILKSTNKGLNWTASTLPSPGGEVENIAFASATNGMALAYINANDKGVFRTSDGGTTWTMVSSPSTFYYTDLTNIPGTTNSFVTVGAITSGSNTNAGLNFTSDGGTTWTNFNAPAGTNEPFSVNFLDQTLGFAGSYTTAGTSGGTVGGIYKLVNLFAPCTGTPTAGTIPATITVCPGGSRTIMSTGSSSGTGIVYQWEESDDNGVADPWAPAVGGSGATTASYTIPANFTTSRYYRLRVTCSASTMSAISVPTLATFSSGAISAFPYTENFNNVTTGSVPCGYIINDANTDGFTWNTADLGTTTVDNALVYRYNSDDATIGADDWFFTPALTMQAGYEYLLTFDYRAALSTFPEGLEVRWGTAAAPASMPAGNTVFSNTSISNNTFTNGAATAIRPAANGTYYIGFHGISAADQFNLYVDNLNITERLIIGVKENVLTHNISVYPNPSNGIVKVTVNELNANVISAEVVNSLGQTVYNTTLSNNQTNELNLSDLASGMYILKVKADNNITTKRITIQK